MSDFLKLNAVSSTTRFARLVRESGRFWMRVALKSRATARYRLRESDVVVYIRHGTVDVLTLDQIVGQGHYELPAEVAAVLEGQPRPLRVVDLGANIGVFGAHILRLYPDAEIIAFEPHPANVEVLRRCIQANRGGQGWQLVAACAGVGDGTVELSVDDEFTTARVDSSAPSTIAVPAVDVFPFLADLDFLKIDIEGSEWHLLEDARFRLVPARVVALEYHDFRCPEPDPRSLAQRRLEEAGYETAEASFEAPPGNGMLWGWRPSLPQ